MRKQYDLAFSIGAACSCTSSLRSAGLQFASFPFDWLAGATFLERVEFIVQDFAHWLDADDLERRPSPEWHAKGIIHNNRTGITFNHDFPREGMIAEILPPVKEKFARRIARLYARIRAAKHVLVVYQDTPVGRDTQEADLLKGVAALEAKFPGVSFDVINFRYRSGVSHERAEIRMLSPHVKMIAFDFKETDPAILNRVPHASNITWITVFLRAYMVPDYRTKAEKMARRKVLRQKDYARYGATSWIEFLYAKLAYKLYRHLEKRLRRRGMTLG